MGNSKERMIKARFQQKHDLEINWDKAVNFIPMDGEIIIYDAEEFGNEEHLPVIKDADGHIEYLRDYWITYPRIKIGDGKKYLKDLRFVEDPNDKTGVGSSTTANSEIFNDYKFNEAYGPYSHTEGKENISGILGYKILDFYIGEEGNWIRVVSDTNEGDIMNYEPGDVVTIVSDSAKYLNCSIITNNKVFQGFSRDLWHFSVDTLPFTEFDLEKNFRMYVLTKPGGGNASLGEGAHAEGVCNRALEKGTHAEGNNTLAGAAYSHAEGDATEAIGHNTHAEGYSTKAIGNYSHTEGQETKAEGHCAHAEGRKSQAKGSYSHTEGFSTTAEKHSAHAEGRASVASGQQSHAEGYGTIASGYSAHSEGSYTKAAHDSSHASGFHTTTTNDFQFVCGKYNLEDNDSTNEYLFVVGNGTGEEYPVHSNGFTVDTKGNGRFAGKVYSNGKPLATEDFIENNEVLATKEYVQKRYVRAGLKETATAGSYSTAEGKSTTSSGEASHAEGNLSTAEGISSHAEGHNTIARSQGSHSEGYGTQATNTASHAEGRNSQATGAYSHAEGEGCVASASASHAEGFTTTASKQGAHAEGYKSNATGLGSHAEGESTTAQGDASHTEGYGTSTDTLSYASHAEGWGTVAAGDTQHVEGRFNILDTGTNTLTYKKKGRYAHILGNGVNKNTRSNAHTIDWSGNAWFAGKIKIGGTGQDDATAKTLATEDFVKEYMNQVLEGIENGSY